MKKLLLFTAALCCMMSATAQKSNETNPFLQAKENVKWVEQFNRMAKSYTAKIDSAEYSDGKKEVFQYDNRLNCTKVSAYYYGTLYTFGDFEYDAQDRIVSQVYTYVSNNGGSKRTMEYDAAGHLSVYHLFSKQNGEWEEFSRYIYEYDSEDRLHLTHYYYVDYNSGDWYEHTYDECVYTNGLLTECIYYFSDGEGGFFPHERTTWDYNDQQWCMKREEWDRMDGGEWHLGGRIEYTHYDDGNVKEELTGYLDGEAGEIFYPTGKTEYEYDNHNNVTKASIYYCDVMSSVWTFDSKKEMEYDQSVPVANIAGFERLFGDNPYYKDKVVKITATDASGNESVDQFYYSAVNSVDENNEALLSVWPNPASETLNLNAEGLQQVEIFSMDGRQVMHLENGFETVSVSTLANGCYLLKATFADGTKAMRKFVKE